MTAAEAHKVTMKLARRAFLSPLKQPICAACGPLTKKPIDPEDARIAGKRHTLDVELGRVVTS